MTANNIIKKNKTKIIKGCSCGALTSIIIAGSIIFHFFFEMTVFSTYLFACIAGAVTILFLISNNFKDFFISLVSSIILFIIAEVAVINSGVILYFFKLRYGAGESPWAGDGFGVLISYMFCLSGSGIGALVALFVTAIKNHKH